MTLTTWNIQGLGTKYNEVFREIEKMEIDLCVLTETKKKGKGNENVGQYIHIYSGVNKNERAKRGVSVAIHKKYKKCIKSWEEIDDRIIQIELNIRGHDLVILGVYAPTDNVDSKMKDEFYEKLTKILSGIKPRKEIFILGDLNGRTGKADNSQVVGKYGEEIVNDSGERLIEFCQKLSLKITNGFFAHKMIHKYTWIQATRNLSFIIDYVIQRQDSNIKIMDVRVHRGLECGSDHYLLKAIVMINYKAMDKQESHSEGNEVKPQKYNIDSLKHESTQFLYKLRLMNKLSYVQDGNAQYIYEAIKTCIHEAAYEALGAQEHNSKGTPAWWTKELEEKIKLKKLMYNTWLSTKDAEDRKTYARINREVKKQITQNKNNMWEEKCKEIDQFMGGTKVAEGWKVIKSLKKDVRNNSNITLIATKEWEEHYKKLLTEGRPEYMRQEIRVTEHQEDGIVEEITVTELENALKGTKNGRAPGPGGIAIELVKHGPEILKELIVKLFNKCMMTDDEIPEEWNLAYLSSIHKKGSRKVCGNYRGISVTSSLGRLYGKILKQRIEANFKDIEEQSGFRAGRSCLDNIFLLRQLTEKRTARSLDTHLLFIDLEKAYDSVPIYKLFDVLTKSGLQRTYVTSIYKLYKNCKYAIKTGNMVSGTFQGTKGLRQGCSISPTLFKIYIQQALHTWSRKCSKMGIEIEDNCLFTLLFADDQVIISNDEDDMNYMVRKLIEEYTNWGLKLNINKTEYLVVGGKANDIDIEDGKIKPCSAFKYLGSIISDDATCQKEIKSRTTQGKVVIQKLNSILWSTKMKMHTKKTIYKAIVEPILTYGAECWHMNTRDQQRIQAVEMDFYRRACRISRLDHITNDMVRQRADVNENVIDRIESRQLIWYGHVKRMTDERWPQRMMNYRPINRRKRGRPRRTWEQGISEFMEIRALKEDDWEDRSEWRLRCRKRRQL